VHPFAMLMAFVLIPLAIELASFLLPRWLGWGISVGAWGTGVGLLGATFAWWLCFALMDPSKRNNVEIVVWLGFVSLATLFPGAAMLSWFMLGLVQNLSRIWTRNEAAGRTGKCNMEETSSPGGTNASRGERNQQAG
jgi:hypothetical protein